MQAERERLNAMLTAGRKAMELADTDPGRSVATSLAALVIASGEEDAERYQRDRERDRAYADAIDRIVDRTSLGAREQGRLMRTLAQELRDGYDAPVEDGDA